MELTVLVERVGTNGYTARDPFGRTATGATADEAVAKLQAELTRQVQARELVKVWIPWSHPVVQFGVEAVDDLNV